MASSTMSNLLTHYNYLTNVSLINLYYYAKWNVQVDYLYEYNLYLFNSLQAFNASFYINNIINLLFIIFVFGVVVFYSLFYGARFLNSYSNSADSSQVVFTYFSDLEEEMGSVDDSLFYFLVFGLIIVWFFFLTLWVGFLNGNITWIVSLFSVVGLTAIIIPLFVLKNFGLACVMYVRGSGRTTSILFEAMLDLVSTAVIMIRFLIQNIRFLFIFSAFFELYEFIYDKIHLDITVGGFSTLTNFLQTSNLYWYDIFFNTILNWILYLYYLGHLILLFIAQLSIYFALSFWLFFFLYTTFTLESQEKYFYLRK